MKIKYPLVSIDVYDGVFRISTHQSKRESMHKIICHQHGGQCTSYCAAFAIAKVNGTDVFICKSASRPIVLGYVDFNSTSMETIQSLEHGSDLQGEKSE